ncbi:MAG: ribosome small subunit-dependent GTPase A, partial [Anaerolineae bacterium]|nr:ribosome small subunit-dependent GTPase A [Anaerolineae bacterium]
MEHQPDGTGVIIEVHEREHVLARVAPSSPVGTSAESQQIIIANCEQTVFVFAAAQPRPQPRMLDRLLVAAEKARIPSIVVCVNKIDLAKRAEAEAVFQTYQQLGYRILYVSAQTGEGMSDLRSQLAGRVSVFTGPSGVGKSSLLNAIQAGLQLQTARVSEAHQKGRHTTRFSQLIPLEGGGYVADTPGIRALAPWDVEPHELDTYYREIAARVDQCRFADCSHQHEPGCAVRVRPGGSQISPARYESLPAPA